jgi:hypothetical protein
VGISPVKTQLLAIAEIALRKSVLPYSCFPSGKGETSLPEKDCFYHHIIPNKDVEKLIPSKTETDEVRIQKLEQYVNQPHIKSVIIDNGLTNKDYDHGEVIHAAIPGRTIRSVYGHFTGRITAVISGAEIRRYHNVITVRIRLYTVKMRPRIRCRVTVLKITRKYGPFTAPY